MKLPKLPAQWEALDQFARDRIEEASDQAAAFLVYAGYRTPQDLDENGEEVGDAVQALLMDAMLRAPHLYLHISKLNELTANPEHEVDLDTARSDFMTWAHNAPMADLRSVRTMRESTLASEFDPMAHMELLVVSTEINLRLANMASDAPAEQDAATIDEANLQEGKDYQQMYLELPDHQREYADRIWSSAFGMFDKPHSPKQWQLMYECASQMDGTVIQSAVRSKR